MNQLYTVLKPVKAPADLGPGTPQVIVSDGTTEENEMAPGPKLAAAAGV